MNLRVNDNRPERKFVKGAELFSVKPGTLIRYERYEGENVSANKQGMLMIRTDNNRQPLICLRSGELWGSSISGDVFEVLENTVVDIHIS